MLQSRRRLMTALVCLLLLALALPLSALAPFDPTVECALTLRYPAAGIEFRLYRVADYTPSGQFQPTEAFIEYPIDFDNPEWTTLAQTLAAYIARDELLEPTAVQATDEAGNLTFEAMDAALYLVLWDRHETDGFIYTPEPYLVALPTQDVAGNRWVYHVTSVPKYVRSAIPIIPTTVRYRVHKVWDDSRDAAGKRPDQIQVQLLCDGRIFDTVTLSPANGWSYEWPSLAAGHTWQVIERDVPRDYTVKLTREGITFLITNTLTPLPPDTTVPPPETTAPPTDTTAPPSDTTAPPSDTTSPPTDTTAPPSDTTAPPSDTTAPPSETTVPPSETTTPGDPLPETGVLWWPVPILAGFGLILLCGGWVLTRRNADHG